jgi:6-phosphogluconolactonase
METRIIRSDTFVKEAVDLIESVAAESIRARGRFVLALSGGKTPEPVYVELARRNTVDWNSTELTFSDERCVPSDEPQSNYFTAKKSLFDHIKIPPENIHRINADLKGMNQIEARQRAETAAQEYENEVRSLKGITTRDSVPVHDLILLGIGDDGHTASLFPGTSALLETNRLVAANFVPKLDSFRITFTYTLISAARHVCFLVNDPRKEAVLKAILQASSNNDSNKETDLPAARVAAAETITWIVGE